MKKQSLLVGEGDSATLAFCGNNSGEANKIGEAEEVFDAEPVFTDQEQAPEEAKIVYYNIDDRFAVFYPADLYGYLAERFKLDQEFGSKPTKIKMHRGVVVAYVTHPDTSFALGKYCSGDATTLVQQLKKMRCKLIQDAKLEIPFSMENLRVKPGGGNQQIWQTDRQLLREDLINGSDARGNIAAAVKVLKGEFPFMAPDYTF